MINKNIENYKHPILSAFKHMKYSHSFFFSTYNKIKILSPSMSKSSTQFSNTISLWGFKIQTYVLLNYSNRPVTQGQMEIFKTENDVLYD